MGSMSAAPIDGKVRGVLSPSRAGDFMSCPLLFRYRTIDRLPEGSSPDAVRGTLVHQVLEDIFDLPAADRTPPAAHRLLEPAWRDLQVTSEQARKVAATIDEPAWLESAHAVLDRWFTLEDPTRLEPAEREAYVEATLPSGLQLRGIVDRLDRAPDGALRVVDYKDLRWTLLSRRRPAGRRWPRFRSVMKSSVRTVDQRESPRSRTSTAVLATSSLSRTAASSFVTTSTVGR